MATIERSVYLTVGAPEALSYFTNASPLATIFAADRAQVDPQEGGRFEIFWPTGDSTEGCKITNLVEGEALTAEFTAPNAHAKFGPEADGTVTVKVRADGDGSVAEVAHEGIPDGEAHEYFEQRWDEWANNLQVLAYSDQGSSESGNQQPRFDLSAVELTQIPHRHKQFMPNVVDQA